MTPSEKYTFSRRIRRLAAVAREFGADKRELTGTILQAWSLRSYPTLPRAALPSRRDLARHPDVQAFVAALEELDFLSAAYWLSSGYAIWGDPEYRKELAMFFTPPSLTRRLLEDLEAQGVDFATHTFCDPACGGAAFLAPIAMRMRDKMRGEGRHAKTILRSVQERLLGSDVDETLCELSRHFLRMVLSEEIERAGAAPRFRVRRANSLTGASALYGHVDVVVCNPPYRKMAADEVELYRENYRPALEAQPNLYGLFVALSLKLLKLGGTAGLVTPTSYLSGQYFSGLRRHIMENAEVLRIGMVSDRTGVFIDVEQETALSLLRKKPRVSPEDTVTSVSVVATDGTYTDVGLCRLPNSGTTWPIPRTAGDEALLRKASEAPARLSNYGYAIRSGSFVWNRDKRKTYRDRIEAVSAGALTAVPLLWSRDIKEGVLSFHRERGDGGDHSFVDLGSKAHSYVVRRPSVILQRVTSNDMSKRLVAAPVPMSFIEHHGGFVGENHTVVLERVDEEALFSPAELTELLSTPTIDRYFRCLSGATNVSAFELSQLALPTPDLVRQHLSAGKTMDEAVRMAFGL